MRLFKRNPVDYNAIKIVNVCGFLFVILTFRTQNILMFALTFKLRKWWGVFLNAILDNILSTVLMIITLELRHIATKMFLVQA